MLSYKVKVCKWRSSCPPTQVSKESTVWVHVVTWSLYLQNRIYITRTARHASPSDRQTSCGLNGLHVGYTTVRYLQQRGIFFFVSLPISIRNLLCTVAIYLRFTPDLPFSTSRLRSGTNGFREPEEIFCSPKRPYRLWDPPSLYFNCVPGFFPRIRRSECDVYHSPAYNTEVVIQ
jgi:WD40 repeat protein